MSESNEWRKARDMANAGPTYPDYHAKQLGDILDAIKGPTPPAEPLRLDGNLAISQYIFGWMVGAFTLYHLWGPGFSGWFWKIILSVIAGMLGWAAFPYLLIFIGVYLFWLLISALGGW